MKTRGKPGAMVAIGLPKGGASSGGQMPDDAGQQDTEGVGDSDAQPGEDCVPLSSLAMPDSENGDQMANPEPGNKVNYQVAGTVTRIEGDNAYVKRESINGQPVSGDAAPDEDAQDSGADESAEGDDQERQALGGMAGQMGGLS